MEVFTIIVLVIVTLLIIYSIIFRKQLNLLIIRLRFGKFSYQFVSKFKKYANKSPFPYCFKDDIMPYLRLVKSKRENSPQFVSDRNVLFENLDYTLTIEELLKKQGDPSCFNVFRIKDVELKAFGYSIEKFETNVKAVFFFINEVYFMAEYLADNIKRINLDLITSQLFDQAGIKDKTINTNFIIDSKNNTTLLFYENGFSLLVRYLDKNNKEFTKIIN